MDVPQMVDRIQRDTPITDTDTIVAKLNAAQDWCWNRILPMNKGILTVLDNEITLAADTHSYDLAAHVSTGTLYELLYLGVKFASDTKFNEVRWCQPSMEDFRWWDQQPVAARHPVLAFVDSFDKLRLAPGLPSGTLLRVDYIYKPAEMSLVDQTTCQLPEPYHEAIVSDATARCFLSIDDTREGSYRREALDALYGAQNVTSSRQTQQQPRTRPSHRRWSR